MTMQKVQHNTHQKRSKTRDSRAGEEKKRKADRKASNSLNIREGALKERDE
jgi:hypothetical protein